MNINKMGICYLSNFVRSMCFKQKIVRKSLCLSTSEPFTNSSKTFVGSVKHQKRDKPISSTSIIVQDGHSIVEMPCIVQIINGEFQVSEKDENNKSGDISEGIRLEYNQVSKTLFKNIDFKEESEMTLGFMRCNSLKEVFNLLNTCPEVEITPTVALAIIRRILDFENNLEYRNLARDLHTAESKFTFTRSALMKRLIDTICASSDPQIVVQTLLVLGRDPNKGDKWNYLDQICTETAILATDGKLNTNQVCDVIRGFHHLGDYGKGFVDKVWVGINEKHGDLNETEICNIMSVLPMVKNSRMYLFKIVERKFTFIAHRIEPDHIIRIVFILVQLKLSSSNLLSQISRWTSLNIHKLTESNLRWIVYAFLSLEFTDPNIQSALSRYLNAKKTHIKDHSLVSVILQYCKVMRIRHPVILDIGSQYFIEHGSCLQSSHLSTMATAFGHLNFLPPNPQKFFHILEQKIEEYFSRFPPDELLDMFLTCVYLERYPLNFVKKLFNPYFFDRLHSLKGKKLSINQEKLQLLDAVLTIEASGYSGPILPVNYGSNSFHDVRIARCVQKITPTLIGMIGREDYISHSYSLPSMPILDTFVIDCLVDASRGFSAVKGLKKGKYALLILMPDDLDLTEKDLMGSLALKKRIIKRFGYKVVPLQYRTLNKLSVYPNRLMLYILDEMKKA